MCWRIKLILLLIVYFAGFATAVYYLAPEGSRQCQAASYTGTSDSGTQPIDRQSVKDFCSRAYTKVSEALSKIDWKDLRDKINCALQKWGEKATSTKSDSNDRNDDK